MRVGRLLASFVFPGLLAAACSDSASSGSTTDGGPTGDGGCLLTTPKEGDPCNDGDALCNPGNLCCEGRWACNTSTHKWSLLRGGCACGDAAAPLDTGSDVASDSPTGG